MFFTLHPESFASHYDEDEEHYVCLGDECPACKAGIKPTEHVYLPVWDAQNRRIAVLKFDTRADGPAARILPFLQNYKSQLADIVAVIDCKGRGEFSLTAHEPLPETDRGALECKEFCAAMESGAIDLRDCVKRLARLDLHSGGAEHASPPAEERHAGVSTASLDLLEHGDAIDSIEDDAASSIYLDQFMSGRHRQPGCMNGSCRSELSFDLESGYGVQEQLQDAAFAPGIDTSSTRSPSTTVKLALPQKKCCGA